MTDTSKTISKLKRSRVLHVSSLMATASFSLAACTQPAPSPSSSSGQEGQWEETKSFQSVEACVASGEPAVDCGAADKAAREEALATAPRFGSQAECESEFGAEQCQEQKSTSGGGSFFMPMLAGFMMARMMNGGMSGGNQMAARPFFKDCRNPRPDGSCNTRTAGGSAAGRAFAGTGAARAATPDSPRSQVARGGFGGSRAYYGG